MLLKIDAILSKTDAMLSKVDAMLSKVGAMLSKVDTMLLKVGARLIKVDARSEKVDAMSQKIDTIMTTTNTMYKKYAVSVQIVSGARSDCFPQSSLRTQSFFNFHINRQIIENSLFVYHFQFSIFNFQLDFVVNPASIQLP
jgi:hypothetical protein